LGSVITTVSDRKLGVDVNTDNFADYYTADILSATDYYSHGSVMPGRSFNPTVYRHGFNGMEKDNEIKGSGNSYNYGARMYDSRLGRWLSTDSKGYKYTSYSPYHAMYNNPIAVIDGDGRENIVVVGNQGMVPASDRVFDMSKEYEDEDYVYGENTRHFLQAGLDEAIRLNQQGGEQTTLLVYRGSYSQKEIDTYLKLATDAGIKYKVLDNVNQIADYINNKNGSLDRRGDDLITDFTYVGHSSSDALWVGNHSGNGKRDISTADVKNGLFDNNAFSCKSTVILNSCQTFAKPYQDKINVGTAFARLAGSGGVTGTSNYVNWGGKLGLGGFTWNSGNPYTNPNGSGVKIIPGTNEGGEAVPRGDGGSNDPDANDRRNEG
ncbi:MAG: RHS repeat-associated core domain-containing protein, partial [Bacteroidia bacterium]